MTTLLDCRGLACPAPVLQTKTAVEKDHPQNLTVIVDNAAAQENVSRFLESQNFQTELQTEGADFHVTATSKGAAPSAEGTPAQAPSADLKKTMVMVATDCMGHGDDELGSKLMINFLGILKEMGEELWRLVFVNSGVKLTIAGSPVLAVLQELQQEGLYILVCGTCLNHFNLLEQKQVGETTNMLDIVTAMQLADKVINI